MIFNIKKTSITAKGFIATSPKDNSKSTYLSVDVDDNGYGTLKELVSYGDVHEEQHLTDLWINYEGFDGAEYDTTIGEEEQTFLRSLFGNIKQL